MKQSEEFDAIVIGTGMGGAAAGSVLVQSGLRVLFLERGLPQQNWDSRYAGAYPESFLGEGGRGGRAGGRAQVYARSGRATYKVNSWIPVLGGGAGGGTAVYGAALFRFHPSDLKTWPGFEYETIAPFYAECEEKFKVRGTKDPLCDQSRSYLPPPPMSSWGNDLFEFFCEAGLHPFRTPIGFENRPGCQQCFGFFCGQDCKKTAANVFLEPILKSGQAYAEYATTAIRFDMQGRSISAIQCSTPNGPREFRAKWFFVAAGALMTPVLLMNSKSDQFPAGVGNAADLVGRYLMRHMIDFYFVRTQSSALAQGNLIEVSATDFYSKESLKWGVLSASPGLMPPSLMADEFVERLCSLSPIPLPKSLMKLAAKFWLRHITAGRVLVSSILEDSPDKANRVLAGSSSDAVRIAYRLSGRDKKRVKECRNHLMQLFRPLSPNLIKVAEDNSFLAHVCGTCRVGQSSDDGVVDARGRVFGTENLYITDSSIFVSSGGVNPSLTVAACAMKVANQFVRNVWRS